MVSLPNLLPWQPAQLHMALQQVQGHAVLLHGEHGGGQFPLGLALAKAWLCESPDRVSQPACGACPSCHLFDKGAHPDLRLLLPEALSMEWQVFMPDDVDIRDVIDGKRKPSREIKVQAMRDTLHFCQQTSARGRAKVVIVHPAHDMNAITANTLLKTLEEPPGQARFILTTDHVDELMPTIRSRCQPWQLPKPAPADVIAWLQSHDQAAGLKAGDAALLLAAAGASPLGALSLLALGWQPALWLQLPQELQDGSLAVVHKWPLADVVQVQQKICHDLARMQAGGAPRYFPEEALAACLPVSLARLTAWEQELRTVRRQADHPWNGTLKIQAMALRAQQALQTSLH